MSYMLKKLVNDWISEVLRPSQMPPTGGYRPAQR
jgi:hypothetical protein